MQQMILPLLVAVGAAVLLQVVPAKAGTWPSSCGNNKTHNFQFGSMSYYDRLLSTAQVIKPRKFMRVLSFDENISTSGKISYIRVLDQTHEGNGGCVYLSGGGVGFNNVILHFKSKRNYGINFIVYIHGN